MEINNNSLNLSISATEAIDEISKATGNYSFSLMSPLSGSVNNKQFKLTLPIGFSHPFKPVLTGKIIEKENKSIIIYSFVRPWLGIAAFLTIWVVLISMAWPNINTTLIFTVLVITIGVFSYKLRNSDKEKLVSMLLNSVSNKNV